MSDNPFYQFQMPGASHWSLRIKRNTLLTLEDVNGGSNVGMVFYNPENLLERYNAPDTLKCQHTFKLTRGNCLYSDMGRIFCSIVEDSFGWHDTVCGNSHASHINDQWGEKTYQAAQNGWHQNGYNSTLVELAKYGLSKKDIAANVNFFSRVEVDDLGNMKLGAPAPAGAKVALRFEMDTLVILHNCPHPLNQQAEYPMTPINITLSETQPAAEDDFCRNFRPENQRGFENNRLYHLGIQL